MLNEDLVGYINEWEKDNNNNNVFREMLELHNIITVYYMYLDL